MAITDSTLLQHGHSRSRSLVCKGNDAIHLYAHLTQMTSRTWCGSFRSMGMMSVAMRNVVVLNAIQQAAGLALANGVAIAAILELVVLMPCIAHHLVLVLV